MPTAVAATSFKRAVSSRSLGVGQLALPLWRDSPRAGARDPIRSSMILRRIGIMSPLARARVTDTVRGGATCPTPNGTPLSRARVTIPDILRKCLRDIRLPSRVRA